MSLQPAGYSVGVAGHPVGHHAGMPVEHDTFEGATVDHGFGIGLLFGLDGVYAVGKLLFEPEALAGCLGQSGYRVATKGGQALASIGFLLPEPPAFAAVGLQEQAEALALAYPRNPTERQNEKTRQKAGFSGVPEILKAFYGTLNGAGTRNRTRDLLITSQLLYHLSYTGNGASL